MVVQHNLTAMNANRMFGITTGVLAKSTEKLSSGYKINRAADDAAGLSISEKMRKQIRGLSQASLNAEDGISTVQTAEGALAEVHDMLQRMNELAVKSANETNSKQDRSYIQAEVDQLVTEIDRVATTTKFNEIYLLKGKNADGTAAKLTYNTATTNFQNIAGINTGISEDGYIYVRAQQINLGFTLPDGTNDTVITNTFEIGNGSHHYHFVYRTQNNSCSLDEAAKYASNGRCQVYTSYSDLMDAVKVEQDLKGDMRSLDVIFEPGNSLPILKIGVFADINNGMDISLHVGADSSEDNKIGMNINMMSARALGINGIKVNGEDDTRATKAIDTIAAAIQKVSTQRSTLGAIQNRLEHTIKNLDNIVENTTSAESQIRDTDMATEMVKYSNSNVLAQAGQSMLAQANQAKQGVLSLLG